MKEPQEANLIATWLVGERRDSPLRTLTDVVSEKHTASNRRYRLSRIREWERGLRAPDSRAHNYIPTRARPYVVSKAGTRGQSLTQAATDRLLIKLSLPVR